MELDFCTILSWLEINPRDLIEAGYAQRTAYAWIRGEREPRRKREKLDIIAHAIVAKNKRELLG